MATVSVLRLILLLLCLFESEGKAFIKMCYFPNWAAGRASPYARFDVQNMDASLCTHIVYAFAMIDADSHTLVPMNNDEDPRPGSEGRYKRFADLKKDNPQLKTLLSVGGQYAGSDSFVSVTRNDHVLKRFAETTVHFLRRRNFDGLDIDWEYPDEETKGDYTKLLKTLKNAFDADKSRGERLMLTAALPAGRKYIDAGYDFGALTRYLDLANLMTYDYHGSWSEVTGFDSPLHSRKSDHTFNQELSTEWTVNYYMSKGLQADKIVVGVTAAGTRFKLQNRSVRGVGAPVIRSNSSRLSDLWQLPDRYAYPEICRVLQSTLANYTFDEEQQVPYVSLGDDWIGYEDVHSLRGKVDWMMKKGVAGAMFWALDMDDFTGMVCDNGRYPLLRALTRGVGQIEGTHLTEHVNPKIRYMTKASGLGNRPQAFPGTVVSVAAVVVASVMFFCR